MYVRTGGCFWELIYNLSIFFFLVFVFVFTLDVQSALHTSMLHFYLFSFCFLFPFPYCTLYSQSVMLLFHFITFLVFFSNGIFWFVLDAIFLFKRKKVKNKGKIRLSLSVVLVFKLITDFIIRKKH